MEKLLMFIAISVSLLLIIGCTPPMTYKDSDRDGLPDDVEENLGTDPKNPDTDGDGVDDGQEDEDGSDPTTPDRDPVADKLQPYLGSQEYGVISTMGAYTEESGEAMFTWMFANARDRHPSTKWFACVKPIEMPDRFREKYDSGEAIKDRETVDKKADNLYIPFDEDGGISFVLEAKIPGKYVFDICGILDEDYMYQQTFVGENTEVEVEVPNLGLIVVDKGCYEYTLVTAPDSKVKRMDCHWRLQYADGTNYTCGHLYPAQAYEEWTLSDGTESHSLIELIYNKNGESKSYTMLSSVKPSNTIHRSDLWSMGTVGGDGNHGCCGYNRYKGRGEICITVMLPEGDTATVSIGGFNPAHFDYRGDGDAITITN